MARNTKCFNPKLVRLEAQYKDLAFAVKFLFQSQTGSIRSCLYIDDQRAFKLYLFQSQTGSIRSRDGLELPKERISFNPKLVRLEDGNRG